MVRVRVRVTFRSGVKAMNKGRLDFIPILSRQGDGAFLNKALVVPFPVRVQGSGFGV